MAQPLISIIDDDLAVRKALGSLVRSVGYQTEVFCSAEDFLASRVVGLTDCLITDIQMPGLTGIELKKILDDSDVEVPVIMITAHQEANIDEIVRKCGARCLLRKPFDAETLISCIARALGQ